MLGEMRGRKYQGNVKEAIVSMQKRFSYNPTFMRKIKKMFIKSRACVLPGRNWGKCFSSSNLFHKRLKH